MKDLTREQLIRRIKLIEEDIINLFSTLDKQGVATDVENSVGTSVDTYYSNIMACCDIDDNGAPTDEDGARIETEWKLGSEVTKPSDISFGAFISALKKDMEK
jgi:hypothetical protein